MKKVIFKGIVDGVNFDNVKDYNAAITAGLKEGHNVEASSSTQIVNTEDEVPNENLNGVTQEMKLETSENCTCNNKCKGCYKDCEHKEECPDQSVELPGFNSKEPGKNYIDNLVSKDGDEFNKNLEKLDVLFDSVFDKIVDKVNSSTALKEKYKDKICNILDQINLDKNANNKAYNTIDHEIKLLEDHMDQLTEKLTKIQDNLEELYSNLDVLDQADAIIETYNNFYESLMDQLDDENEEIKTKTKENIPQQELNLNTDLFLANLIHNILF